MVNECKLYTFAMTEHLQSRNQFFHKLRNSELQAKSECRHYKLMYSKQCKQMKSMKKYLTTVENKLKRLEIRCKNLRQKCASLHDTVDPKMKNRKRKSWSNIKCEHTKCQ